jgi:hypothetical protein
MFFLKIFIMASQTRLLSSLIETPIIFLEIHSVSTKILAEFSNLVKGWFRYRKDILGYIPTVELLKQKLKLILYFNRKIVVTREEITVRLPESR